MGKAEEMHELIDTNIKLLKSAGHRIDFTPKMFMGRKSGFEAVGQALLMIIDAEECKKKIPWPLINNKAQDREFRTNFIAFIKMINTKYAEARIPEINASSLQYPGGVKFIEFMYKLSTFALQLELKKVMSSEDKDDFLSKPVESNKAGDQKVQLSIIRGALCKELQSLNKCKDVVSEMSKNFEKIQACSSQLKTACSVVNEELKLEVASLDVDKDTKERLLDINDTSAIAGYNEQVEKKFKEMDEQSRCLKELNDLADRCCLMSKQSPEEKLCLDGLNLKMLKYINDSAVCPVVNVDGSVKLVEVLKTAQTTISRFARSPTSASDSLLSPAKDLQVRSRSAAARAHKGHSILRRLLAENLQRVEALRSVAFSKIDPKKVAEKLYLQEQPPWNFIVPKIKNKQSSCNLEKPRQRKSFGSVLRHRNKVTCSYKMRNTTKKNVSSTPIFKTPACRKSLYPVASGSWSKSKRRSQKFQLPQEESISSTATPCIPETRKISFASKTISPQQTPSVRSKRKSINDVIDRYLKLKQTMNNTSCSKNGSDLMNESGDIN